MTNTTNTTNTTSRTTAYLAGLQGLPEPAVVTKYIRYQDPSSGLEVEGDVETLASLQNRAAWQNGRKIFKLRESTVIA